VQRRVELDLETGEHDQLIPELRFLTEHHPLRERFWGLRILALYRSGRAAEALDCYASARTLLVRELGIEPGPQLAELQRATLENDPGLGLAGTSRQVVMPAPNTLDGTERLNQLPADLFGLAGREEELLRITGAPPGGDAAAPGVRILAIDGMAGVGAWC